MSQHTPGPWYESSTGNHQGLVISEATGSNVAVTYDKADAKLVAAAPEMLAALKRLLADGGYDDDGDFVLYHEPSKGEEEDTSEPSVIRTIAALLAKIDGAL